MSIDNYLSEQAKDGQHDSAGVFTLDLSKAASRLEDFALPSSHHYLLKVVQIASQLGAQEMRFKLEKFRTSVHFRAPVGGSVTNSEHIYRAFADPLNVQDELMSDLISALLGSLTKDVLEILWSYSEGHRGRRVKIKERHFEAKDFVLSKPLAEEDFPCAFTLSVLHPKTWLFWKASTRQLEASQLIEATTKLSRLTIFIDGRQMETAAGGFITEHRSSGDQGLYSRQGSAYHCLHYATTIDCANSFRLCCPSHSNYLVRNGTTNVWGAGTRPNNTLRPDGRSSPTWFIRFNVKDEYVNLRQVEKRVLCRAVVGYDDNAPQGRGLRLVIVRNSVIVLDETPKVFADKLSAWNGAILILADNTLETDLTGFQVATDESFLRLIEAAEPLLEKAKQHWHENRDMVNQ